MLRDSIKTLKSRPQLYQAKLGVYIFIVSLAVFFLASLIAYAVIRTMFAIDLKPLVLPASFYYSTILLLGVSVCLHLGVVAIRSEKMNRYHWYLGGASFFSIAFLALQGNGLADLIQTHASTALGFGKLYGISFTLALVHALHVVGGIVLMIYVVIQTRKGRYDHERHWTVDICATYWHFLDAVWILMLATFWLIEYRLTL